MIILPIGTLLILTVLFQRKFASKDIVVFYGFTAIKFLSAVLVGLLYQYHYQIQGDTFTVFYQARDWYQALLAKDISGLQWLGLEVVSAPAVSGLLPSEPRTRFFAYFVSYLMPISYSNYYVLAIWMSFFQVISMWLVVKSLIQKRHMPKWVVYVGLLFIPSLTFWSAGLLKETLMLMFMAIIVQAYLSLIDSKPFWKLVHLLIILLSAFLLFQIKYYVVILLLPLGFITHLFTVKGLFNGKPFKARLILYFTLLIAGVAIIAVIHPVFHSGRFFELIKVSHDQIILKSVDGIIYFSNESEAFLFTLFNAPKALLTAFFRPFIWEGQQPFFLALAIESTVFTGVFLFSIYSFRMNKLSTGQYFWLLAAGLYVLAMGLIITLSTPNFGSLVRYKVAYMPICWLSCLWLVNKYFSVRKL